MNELYLESKELGLKGKIDILDVQDEQAMPVERKRAASGRYYWNDELQLTGYCMLLEANNDEPVREGRHLPLPD